ncbi:MAG: trypsin-like serine protease, partial [Hyphomonadaceae bacterium]|nr:trypsin-like serine protease [Hyphomonadaceae bacterium]
MAPNSKSSLRPWFVLAAVFVSVAVFANTGSRAQSRASVEALTSATPDPSTRANDAVVSLGWENSGPICTGTLVAPTLVLTAGHCFDHSIVDGGSGQWNSQSPVWRSYQIGTRTEADWMAWVRGDRAGVRPHTFVEGAYYDRPADVTNALACAARCNEQSAQCQAWMFNTTSHTCALMPAPRMTVRFGNTHESPTQTIVSTTYSTPGRADIVMMRLDTPAPSSLAIPAQVLSYLPDGEDRIAAFLRAQHFYAVGFTSAHPQRLRATMNFNNYPYDRDLAMVGVLGELGASTEHGDSGGPLFATRTVGGVEQRFMVGVLQGFDSSDPPRNRYTLTGLNLRAFGQLLPLQYNAATLDRTQAAPIGEWLNNVMYADFVASNPRFRPLYNWFSDSRGDNFLTSDPRWASDPRTIVFDGRGYLDPRRFQDGYQMYRLEGYVFDPHGARPPGTVPLWTWYSEARGDNFTTSDPHWAGELRWNGEYLAPMTREGYRLVRMEGYIFDPHLPQPRQTRPLYSWFSDSRGDNFQTTDAHWMIPANEVHWNGEYITAVDREGYRLYRLEGYVP